MVMYTCQCSLDGIRKRSGNGEISRVRYQTEPWSHAEETVIMRFSTAAILPRVEDASNARVRKTTQGWSALLVCYNYSLFRYMASNRPTLERPQFCGG